MLGSPKSAKIRYLEIDNTVYKHHSTVIFNGSLSSGHFTSLIKIDDEYFFFDDEIVTALFYYNRCSPDLWQYITMCNNKMNRRGTLFEYEK